MAMEATDLKEKDCDEEQEKLAAEISSAGMTEEQIEQMHLFVWSIQQQTKICEITHKFLSPENIDEEDGSSGAVCSS